MTNTAAIVSDIAGMAFFGVATLLFGLVLATPDTGYLTLGVVLFGLGWYLVSNSEDTTCACALSR